MNWHKLIWIALAAAQALIQAVLVGAKLSGRIDWSWWWTLTPLWTPLACVIVAVVACLVFFGAASARGENPFQ